MRAWILHQIGDIRLEEVQTAAPPAGEVLIRVKAAGVCGSDIPRIYQNGAHRMPLVPGHEFCGVVVRAGSREDSAWEGKRVGVYPLIPCKSCASCLSNHPETCRNYDYIGSRRDGAFAEYVSVPVANLRELPEKVTYEEAAMLEPMAVAVHALRSMWKDPSDSALAGQRVVVCGLGTIGFLLCMFLLECGVKELYVIGNRKTQCDRVGRLGIDKQRFCNSTSTDVVDWILQNTGGADVFFDCVGKEACVNYGLGAAACGGRIVLLGNPSSDMHFTRESYWEILRRQLTLHGVWNSTFLPGIDGRGADDWQYVLDRLVEGRIRPGELITQRYPLDELETGLQIMRDKTEDYCKVMVLQ